MIGFIVNVLAAIMCFIALIFQVDPLGFLLFILLVGLNTYFAVDSGIDLFSKRRGQQEYTLEQRNIAFVDSWLGGELSDEELKESIQ